MQLLPRTAPWLLALALGAASPASALDVLLTNDDGCDSPGIQILRGALLAAGHDVILVAPATEQSGRGGALTTDTDAQLLLRETEPGVYCAKPATPSDAARIGLDVVLAGSPPDVVVSGANLGQNLGMPGTWASGTVNAALAALDRGVPAIAVSVGFNFTTVLTLGFEAAALEVIQSFPDTGAFIVQLLAALEAQAAGGPLLPERTMLNVNVPAPYSDVIGVLETRLDEKSDFNFAWTAVPVPGKTDQVVTPEIGVNPPTDFTFPPETDRNANFFGFISITPLDGDMTSADSVVGGLGLTP